MKGIVKLYVKIKKIGLYGMYKIIMKKVIQPYYIYKIDLSNSFVCKRDLIKLDYESIKLLGDYNESNEIPITKLDILKSRILLDDVADFTFFNDGQVSGHYGLAFKNNPKNQSINNMLMIPDGTSYLFDDYTKIRFRGCGYHKDSIYGRLQISKAKGYKNSIVLIYKDNIASCLSYEKVGFIKVGSVYEVKLFNKRIIIGGSQAL